MTTRARKVDLTRFWKKFLRLTRGRVAVLRALTVISQEEEDPRCRRLIEALTHTVEKGCPLSAAMAEHPQHFSRSVVELLKTAEKTGAWEEILPEIVGGLEDGTFD